MSVEVIGLVVRVMGLGVIGLVMGVMGLGVVRLVVRVVGLGVIGLIMGVMGLGVIRLVVRVVGLVETFRLISLFPVQKIVLRAIMWVSGFFTMLTVMSILRKS